MINRIVILTILLSSLFMPSAFAEVDAEIAYIFNTFSFLVCGFLVMWMAAGFCMLESWPGYDKKCINNRCKEHW
jgi:Amt family ammonium transporter